MPVTLQRRNLYNIIDVEATCWDKGEGRNGQPNEIIEIGISVVDCDQFEIISTESILVQPVLSTISPFCTELTTITTELIEAEAIPFEDAINKLVTVYDSKNRVWCSWGKYDLNEFNRHFETRNVENCFGIEHINIKALFSKEYNRKRQLGMDKALNISQLPLEGTHHRGGDDSKNIAKLFIHLLMSPRNRKKSELKCM